MSIFFTPSLSFSSTTFLVFLICLYCFVYVFFTLYLLPLLALSLVLPPFEGSILNLASVPVPVLALPLREAGGQAEEPLFSRPFLWMKRWNKGMKALGKVWKLPIHQCKEIPR